MRWFGNYVDKLQPLAIFMLLFTALAKLVGHDNIQEWHFWVAFFLTGELAIMLDELREWWRN